MPTDQQIVAALSAHMGAQLGLSKAAFLPLPGGQPMPDPAQMGAPEGAPADPAAMDPAAMQGAAGDPMAAAGGDPMAAAGGDPMAAAGAMDPAAAQGAAPAQGAPMSEDALMSMPIGQLTVDDFMGILQGLIEAVQGGKGKSSGGGSGGSSGSGGKLDEIMARLDALEGGVPGAIAADQAGQPGAMPAPAPAQGAAPAPQKQAMASIIARTLHGAARIR